MKIFCSGDHIIQNMHITVYDHISFVNAISFSPHTQNFHEVCILIDAITHAATCEFDISTNKYNQPRNKHGF